MKRIFASLGCVLMLWVLGLRFVRGHQRVVIRGFFPAAAAREFEAEKILRAAATPERAERDLLVLTQAPHVAGTPEDYQTAQYVLGQFREAGLNAQIVEYQVLLPMPKQVKVDLVEPFKREGPTPEGGGDMADKTSFDLRVVPAFNAYSPSGDVTEQVVYANYGMPDDYQRLKALGVDVAGKIVIVRYGKCFRGVKAYVAEENRAAGLLIYSDPADDGYRQGDTYPRGPWRPRTSVQRGSILYNTVYAGDPLTPGQAATKDAKRLSLAEAKTLPHIPSTPLSYEDASPILENLSGPVAPREWQGALPFAYHLGPGSSKVHLKLDMDFRVRPIWNVVAETPGSDDPDAWVVLGNHRDAWAYGAVDPNSGTAPLLAVARGLGRLLKQGWKPRRTLVLASWDAEEFGLIGSTEWAEEHAEELTRGAVAYLNMDIGVSGPHFGASAVPSLAPLIREVAREVSDPKSGRPVYSVWAEESQRFKRDPGNPIVMQGSSAGDVPPGAGEPRVTDLGSGSDYTAFLQHLGVPSVNLGFEGSYGVYHSAYDDFRWMKTFGDPDFKYSVAASQILGTLALRLADADVLPFDYEGYAKAMDKYLRDMEQEMKAHQMGDKLSFEGALAAASRFAATAKALGRRVADLDANRSADPDRITRGKLATLNRALADVERDFLLEKGLPNRFWFRHAFYAPGVYTGYEAVLIPGVREAVERKDWRTASEQLGSVRQAIERATATLTRAVDSLGRPAGAGTSP